MLFDIAARIGNHSQTSSGVRLAAIVAVCIALAGCSQTTGGPAHTPRSVPLSEAMIFPPPGGPALVSVVETGFANATHQSIALATNARTRGESKFVITRFSEAGGDGNFGELEDISLLQSDLLAEAQAAWPDAAMEVSPFFAQNAYGPFGYAVGRAPSSDICLYGWQRIAPGLSPSGSISRGTVTIRLQVCDTGAGEERLLNLMYLMRLRDPVFEPWRASPRIGMAGQPIVPTGADGRALVYEPPQTPAAAPASRPAQPVANAPAQPAPAPVAPPQPTGPTVPLPPGSTGTSPGSSSPVVVPPPPTADD